MKPMTAWAIPTASTRTFLAGTPWTARACRWTPPCISASCTTTPSGTASRWSSATVTARSLNGSPRSLSVIGHELAHGVTQFSAGLAYRNQAGALNESMSDVFGALVEQYVEEQSAAEASWLIGEGLFTPEGAGHGAALHEGAGNRVRRRRAGQGSRSLTPWTTMCGPALTTAASTSTPASPTVPSTSSPQALGGNAWDAPGRIWYDTLTGGSLPPTATFGVFARATAASAVEIFGAGSAEHDAVAKAWETVKVKL